MPHCEAGNGPGATIDWGFMLGVIRRKLALPAARQGPSTTNQSLTPRLNELRARCRSSILVSLYSGISDLAQMPTAGKIPTRLKRSLERLGQENTACNVWLVVQKRGGLSRGAK